MKYSNIHHGLVIIVNVNLVQLIEHFKAFCYESEDGMLAIKSRQVVICQSYEEL